MNLLLGGAASVYLGQPLDTVKVKLQTFPHLYNNFVDCFKKTLRNEGIFRGLYAGTVPSLAAQVIINTVCYFHKTKNISWLIFRCRSLKMRFCSLRTDCVRRQLR